MSDRITGTIANSRDGTNSDDGQAEPERPLQSESPSWQRGG